jgi:hypothetical protein
VGRDSAGAVGRFALLKMFWKIASGLLICCFLTGLFLLA